MKLSICICSLAERSSLLSRLLGVLSWQRHPEMEVLVAIDSGDRQLAQKRNRLIAQARGEYVAHIDDDDLVSPSYVRSILTATEESPDAITVRGVRTDAAQREAPIVFDYCKMSGQSYAIDANGVLWRSPGHVCAVKTSIAREVPFPTVIPEDLEWVALVSPRIETIARAGNEGEILYHYLWDSEANRWYEKS